MCLTIEEEAERKVKLFFEMLKIYDEHEEINRTKTEKEIWERSHLFKFIKYFKYCLKAS